MADTKTKRASQVRKKQILLLSGISLAVIVIALGASALMQPGKKKEVPLQQQAKTRTLQVGSADAEREAWRIQSGSELQNIAKQITDLNNKVTGLQEENKKLKEGNQAGSIAPPIAPGSNAVMPPAVPPSMQTNGKTSPFGTEGSEGGIPPPLRADGTTAQPNATGRMAGTAKGTLDGSRIRSVAINEPDEATKVAAADKPGVKTDLVNSSKEFGSKSKRGADGKERFADDDPLDINRAGGRTAETYLPTGTTMRVVLLNGLDAPTGGQSQSNPMPVNLMVDAAAQLPNGVKANLKGCFITGSGHGDLSSERAFVRLDRLSCVDEDGGAIDVAVKGYVSGEDGKSGLRGKLVSKTGAVLANAIFVGTIGGFGEGLRQSATQTDSFGALGQTQSVKNPWTYGMGSGVGKAMDRVAQYYIKLADKMFPIVEIDGGRVVDVVLTRGVSIERK